MQSHAERHVKLRGDFKSLSNPLNGSTTSNIFKHVQYNARVWLWKRWKENSHRGSDLQVLAGCSQTQKGQPLLDMPPVSRLPRRPRQIPGGGLLRSQLAFPAHCWSWPSRLDFQCCLWNPERASGAVQTQNGATIVRDWRQRGVEIYTSRLMKRWGKRTSTNFRFPGIQGL